MTKMNWQSSTWTTMTRRRVEEQVRLILVYPFGVPGTSQAAQTYAFLITWKRTAMGAFSNIKGLTYYGDNADDPYITLEAVSQRLRFLSL
jgi:hypothetical protein